RPALRGHRRHHRGNGEGRHPGRRCEEGRRRQGGRRPYREGAAAPGRLVHPVRRERRGHHQGRRRPPRYPYLRPGRPGAAGQAVHEDHFPRPGGAVAVKVKKGDTVVVIAGKDRGAKGKVIAAYPKLDKVLVEGVNRVKKHTRIRTTQRGAKTGGIVTQEAPIHVSNVMVV